MHQKKGWKFDYVEYRKTRTSNEWSYDTSYVKAYDEIVRGDFDAYFHYNNPPDDTRIVVISKMFFETETYHEKQYVPAGYFCEIYNE